MRLLNLFAGKSAKQADRKKMDYPEFTCINVNEECFFRCEMCHKWKPDMNIAPGTKKMTAKEIKDFAEDLRKIVPDNHILNFAGGEPFLRPDMLDILRHASRQGFFTQIATNGWLIDSEEKAEAIVKSGLGGIIFSVDGATADTHDRMRGMKGSFDRANRAIAWLGKYRDKLQSDRKFNDRLCISIQTVLCELNYHEAPKMIEWVDSCDIRSVHFNAVSEPNNTKHDKYWYRNEFSRLWPKDLESFNRIVDHIYERKVAGSKIAESAAQIRAYKSYFSQPEKFVKAGPCNFDRSLTLSSTGDMFLCFNYESIGNIRDIRFTDAWESEKSRQVRESIKACKNNCHFLINCYFEE
ncbi:MAG: radical SAM protein [Nanoarchaeota archaeon]|nr:radical SAM protein [Nanoarchaeota archaeon]